MTQSGSGNNGEREVPLAYVTQDAFMEAIGNVYAKLDKISERQIDYIERTARIEAIVTNGLTSNVNGLRKDVAQFISVTQASISDLDKRLRVVEAFAWFRDWITAVKDAIFKNVMKLAFLGAILAAAAYCGWGKIKGLFP